MKGTIATIVLASTGVLAPAISVAQPGSEKSARIETVSADQFLSGLRGSAASDFLLVLPEESNPVGEWTVVATISIGNRTEFAASATLEASDASQAFPAADAFPTQTIRFDDTPALRALISATEAATADAHRKYGRGVGELEVAIHTPEGFLAASPDICNGHKQLFFDMFVAGQEGDSYRRVSFSKQFRDIFGSMLLASCQASQPQEPTPGPI